MRGSIRYTISVLATGIMVLVFFAIPMFAGRFCCDLGFVITMPRDARSVRVSPSGFTLPAPESEPNGPQQPSKATARLDDEAVLATFGIIDYVVSYMPGGRRCDVFSEQGDDWLYFDEAAGQIVFWGSEVEWVDGERVQMRRQYFAGPRGISGIAGQDLGRFASPVVKHRRLFEGGGDQTIVYDPSLRRFFALDWRSRTVRSGQQMHPSYRFTEFGSGRVPNTIYVDWRPAMYRTERQGVEDPAPRYEWHVTVPFVVGDGWRYIPILRDSGRVDLLDSETMEILEGRGSLPVPETLFGQGGRRPSQLLAYAVQAVYAYHKAPAENEYVGMVVADASRQGTSMALAEFDGSGNPVGREVYSRGFKYPAAIGDERPDRLIRSASVAVWQTRCGPVLTAAKYVLESLHPPVLTLASFFAADRIQARAGHRALFLIPNSFAAMQRDRVREHVTVQLGWALWFMLPAWLLSAFFMWRVSHDAYAVGLSPNARLLWAMGTLLFGLPAYITYRLTRPAGGLVTCANCGHARRTDMEKCHRCGSPWLVPELVAPGWSVIGEPDEQSCDETPAKPEETVSPA